MYILPQNPQKALELNDKMRPIELSCMVTCSLIRIQDENNNLKTLLVWQTHTSPLVLQFLRTWAYEVFKLLILVAVASKFPKYAYENH